ncbi:hypothetical protein RB195_008954 [Necator americanus]|uniref:Peptidase S1 domain-containing protein n=1 Tax=Necator americanus TaxID=51031 RepID=A0ABR1CRV4_NECAM
MRHKVMGGIKAAEDELPWAVLLDFLKTKKLCGGTLISKKHVITAAHCFTRPTDVNGNHCRKVPLEELKDDLRVYVGRTCLKVNTKHNCTKHDLGMRMFLKRAFYDIFFNTGCRGTHDIAILELTEDVPKNIHHICLPHLHDADELSDPLLRLSSFGWGADPANNFIDVATPFLQKINLGSKMTDKECKKEVPSKQSDTFCTRELPDRNVCHGDSGGGIVASLNGRAFLMGLVSYGSSCTDLLNGMPPGSQVNTDVMHYTDLIDTWIGARKHSKNTAVDRHRRCAPQTLVCL